MAAGSPEPWKTYETEIFPDFLLCSFIFISFSSPPPAFLSSPFLFSIILLWLSVFHPVCLVLCSNTIHTFLSNHSRNGWSHAELLTHFSSADFDLIFSFGCLLSRSLFLGKCAACGWEVGSRGHECRCVCVFMCRGEHKRPNSIEL